MPANDEIDRETVLGLLRPLRYWWERFQKSRDVEHLDHALRFSEALQDYLPKCLQGLNLIGYVNLYELLPGTRELINRRCF